MRPLTDSTPKPLLKAGGKPLIEYSIENLSKAGLTQIVINIAHLGNQIKDYCGDGQRWGVEIGYSDEGETALETAGGIAKALPLLGGNGEPFLVVNADVICDYPLARLLDISIDLAHLVMIANPPHHPQGDFCLLENGLLSEHGEDKLTFSGIGVYNPMLFKDVPPGPLKLRPLLNRGMREQRIGGEAYGGLWLDIGTPERLREIDEKLS